MLPGTKSTMEDLLWLRQSGLEAEIKKLAASGTPVLGICGGYQMLGEALDDPEAVERAAACSVWGCCRAAHGLSAKKHRRQVTAAAAAQPFAGAAVTAYEIHWASDAGGRRGSVSMQDGREEGTALGNVFRNICTGLFDTGELTQKLAAWLLENRGLDPRV